MFNPGETVIHRYTIPFVSSEVSLVVVSYKQRDNVFFVKKLTSGFTPGSELTETIFDVALTQEESLLFNENDEYRVQLNVYTSSGSRMASAEIKDHTGPQQYKTVMRREVNSNG